MNHYHYSSHAYKLLAVKMPPKKTEGAAAAPLAPRMFASLAGCSVLAVNSVNSPSNERGGPYYGSPGCLPPGEGAVDARLRCFRSPFQGQEESMAFVSHTEASLR